MSNVTKKTVLKNDDVICMVSVPKKNNKYNEAFRKMVYEKVTKVMMGRPFKDADDIKEEFMTKILPNLEGEWKIEDIKNGNGCVAVQPYTYIKEGEEKTGRNLIFLNAIFYDESKVGISKNKKKSD